MTTAPRDMKIRAKQQAIERRLAKSNVEAKVAAGSKIDPKKGGTAKYDRQYIKGASEGFTPSDYGVGTAGAAIPYQIGTNKGTVSRKPMSQRPTKMIKNPKPVKEGAVIRTKSGYKKSTPSSSIKNKFKTKKTNPSYRGGISYTQKR